MSAKDYLPKAYALLLEWLITFLSYTKLNKVRFGVSDDDIDTFNAVVALYKAAQEAAILPNAGKADRVKRKELAKTVSLTARDFVNLRLRYNPAVTDEDRVNLGLTVPNPGPSPTPEIKTWPVVVLIDTSVIMRISLRFRDSDSVKSSAKPYGVHGGEIRWCILDHPPVTTEDLIHSEFSTRASRTFVFDENQRGKTVYFRLRWENMRGQKGPWSEIYSAVIP
ncbi:MAG: hypothetical protein LBL07_12120 [Tannerella sp.]|jgi:hypothetical protein|nr:hypothetical protein [Tannerella sp.]